MTTLEIALSVLSAVLVAVIVWMDRLDRQLDPLLDRALEARERERAELARLRAEVTELREAWRRRWESGGVE